MSYRINQRSPRKVRGFVVGLSWALLVTRTSPLYADEKRADFAKITLVGRATELSGLLKEWSSTFDVVGSGPISADDILDPTAVKGQLRIWVVVSSLAQVRLYFADPKGERFYVRDVPLSAGLDEAGRETLAQIIVTTAGAFVKETLVSSVAEVKATFRDVLPTAPGEPATATLEPFAVTVPPVGRIGLTGRVEPLGSHEWLPAVGVFYRATMVDNRSVGHGPGVAVGGGYATRWFRWRVAAQGQYRFPVISAGTDSTLTLRSAAFSVVTGPEWSLATTKRLGFVVGGGFERTQVTLTVPTDSRVLPRSSYVHYRSFLDAATRVGSSLGELTAVVSLGVQVALLRTHYDIAKTPTFSPWLVEPHLGVELNW